MIGRLLRECARTREVGALSGAVATSTSFYEKLVEQAANAFAAPIALITLVHDNRLSIQASQGFPIGCVPREDSFCTHGLDHGGTILEVCDATTNPVFSGLPAVTGAPYVRYYIGAPLILESGIEVGMLCVIDLKARPPASRDQRAYLSGLARHAAIGMDRSARLQRAAAA